MRLLILAVSFYAFACNTLFAQSSTKPVEYIKNVGQWNADFDYKSTNGGADFFLRKTGITFLISHPDNAELSHKLRHSSDTKPFTLKWHAYEQNFVNSNPKPTITQSKIQSNFYNYFIGNDPSQWHSGIHPSLNVDYHDIYKNIDAHFYSESGNLKYDWIVKPGGDARQIQFQFKGLDGLSVTEKGSLSLKTSIGENLELKPYAYQYIDGNKKEVPCRYQINDDVVSYVFEESYDKNITLTIDPIVVFCTFTGSTADNWGYTATYDSLGNFYAGGITGFSPGGTYTGNFPTTVGAFDATFNGGGTGGMGNLYRYDATISKFSANGQQLIYSTYLGGADNDHPQSLVVNSLNQLVVVGRTYSTNYPTKTNAYDFTHNGVGDIFATVFSAAGDSLIGSTFIGGNGDDGMNTNPDEVTLGGLKHNYGDDARSEVIVDANNNIWVTASTNSTNFPLVNAFQSIPGGLQEAVLFKLNSNCTSLLSSS